MCVMNILHIVAPELEVLWSDLVVRGGFLEGVTSNLNDGYELVCRRCGCQAQGHK